VLGYPLVALTLSVHREPEELMDDDREFPPVDAEQARSLLAVAYQSVREAINLNSELARVLEQQDDEQAHRLNDAIFIALNDLKQRLDAVIGASE
jgi:hypothetical protein